MELGNILGIGIGDDKPTKGDNAPGTDIKGLTLGGYFHGIDGQKGVGIALGIGELYLAKVGHRGVAITAMGHHNQLIGAGG